MKTDPQKLRDWKYRSAKKYAEKQRSKPKPKIKTVSKRRYSEGRLYSELRKEFLKQHPICPIFGTQTEEIHHSAHKEGCWLNLQRYWIALSHKAHRYIHHHRRWAQDNGFFVKVNALYDHHVNELVESGHSLTNAIFYQTYRKVPIL